MLALDFVKLCDTLAHLQQNFKISWEILRKNTKFCGIKRFLTAGNGTLQTNTGFYGKYGVLTGDTRFSWKRTRDHGISQVFMVDNRILRERTRDRGISREITGFHGQTRILQENICYFTGDNGILRDTYNGLLWKMTGFKVILRKTARFYGIARFFTGN